MEIRTKRIHKMYLLIKNLTCFDESPKHVAYLTNKFLTFWRRNYFFLILAQLYIKCE